MRQLEIQRFLEQLASKAPVPGGGGAAALSGSMGAALGAMAANLTAGKKKFAASESLMQEAVAALSDVSNDMAALIDADAEMFAPLSQAYGIKADTEQEKQEKRDTIEPLLKDAAAPPMRLVALCKEALLMMERLVDTVSPLVVSDIGCGAQLLRGAVTAGALNVWININMMQDRAFAAAVRNDVQASVSDCCKMADRIYSKVEERLS